MTEYAKLNFLVTNRIPRRLATLLMGRLSHIEHPLVVAVGLALWKMFFGLDLADARTARFRSLHDCFTRQLAEGARSMDANVSHLSSPCDAILGAAGRVSGGTVLQAKGFSYPLVNLLRDDQLAHYYCGGQYATLRLTAGMYHRFHAPYDCLVEQVTYVSGDTWNVNPAATERVDQLFCKNERAIIRCHLRPSGLVITLVPIAAILVASIRLHFADVLLHLRYRGPHMIPCDAVLAKGEEMGWFEHGSTIIVFAPRGVSLRAGLRTGDRIRMGEALMWIDA